MSQSTPEQTEDRVVLFQRGGELSEFSNLLSDLAVPVEENDGALPEPSALEGARLVVVSGKRLLESGAPNLSRWPRTIAVIDDSSRTMVTHLSRAGAAMVIRRPIHPRTLRLLLLHEIYRGPERRGRGRVLVGHPIRIASGLFKPHATLLELSTTGARIELANAPKVGAKIRILFGKDLTKGKSIKLQAKVIRAIRSSKNSNRSASEIGISLLNANQHAKAIKAILDRFALGPAPWQSTRGAGDTNPEATSPSLAQQTTAPEADERTLPPNRSLLQTNDSANEGILDADDEALSDEVASLGESSTDAIRVEDADASAENAGPSENIDRATDAPEQEPEQDDSDRRRARRIPYDGRIVALGKEAARVLVGQDLSTGGMRIEATSSISVGDVLRVALHSGTRTEPIVVVARALRDDGDAGMVFTFEELSGSQSDQLEKIIASSLPVQASPDELEASSDGVVVVEMIESIVSDDEALARVESDDEVDAHIDSVFDTDQSVKDAP